MTDINHRWLRDNENEVFFPITHINAVEGLEGISLTDINDKITEINTTLDTANTTLKKQQETIDLLTQQLTATQSDLGKIVGDSGWVDYSVPSANKNNALSDGFNCGIREVAVGFSNGKNFKIRTVRVHLSNVAHNTQIAQLPNGFVDQTIRFVPSVSSTHVPPTINITRAGVMTVYFPTADQDGKQWVYGQHTWITD